MKRFANILLDIICILGSLYVLYTMFCGEAIVDDSIAQNSAVYIGETVTDKDGVDFCVTSIKDAKTVGSGFSKYSTDANLIILNLSVANNGKDPYHVNPGKYYLVESGNEYEYCNDAIFSLKNSLFMDDINPGIRNEYSIVYETPYKTTEREWKLRINRTGLSPKDNVYIILEKPQS